LKPEHLSLLLPPLRRAARAAGQATLPFYGQREGVSWKADGSPVTAADMAAEAIILPVLRDLTPGVIIVSEESFQAGVTPDSVGGWFWLVDPLDGTKEFLRGNGEFTVNIALIHDETPVLGVIHVPTTDELFTGLAGGEAGGEAGGQAVHQVGDAPPEPIRARPLPEDGATVLSSRSHQTNAELDAWLSGIQVRDRLISGSSVKFCRLAEGKGDLYPRFGPTMEWDTAAGQAILLAAGGRVETPDGTPFRYGKPGFRNGHFIARGRV
jgi:3'(2'), 5'-bisphosphate nucleotidase